VVILGSAAIFATGSDHTSIQVRSEESADVTAQDYARFCQMMLDGGKVGSTQLLSRKSVELMTHDQLGSISKD
jgi:CubicO group peptidase (beta-lactamase class C family)